MCKPMIVNNSFKINIKWTFNIQKYLNIINVILIIIIKLKNNTFMIYYHKSVIYANFIKFTEFSVFILFNNFTY